jgi:hypothetical protein
MAMGGGFLGIIGSVLSSVMSSLLAPKAPSPQPLPPPPAPAPAPEPPEDPSKKEEEDVGVVDPEAAKQRALRRRKSEQTQGGLLGLDEEALTKPTLLGE